MQRRPASQGKLQQRAQGNRIGARLGAQRHDERQALNCHVRVLAFANAGGRDVAAARRVAIEGAIDPHAHIGQSAARRVHDNDRTALRSSNSRA
jgi:hypothetical protein